MKPRKHLAAALWILLAMATSVIAAPAHPTQVHVGGGTTALATDQAAAGGDAPTAQVIPDGEPQYGSAGAAHWALYQCLADGRRPESTTRPDFSGDWILNAQASDDPREKAREAMQASRRVRPGGRGMGGGPEGMTRGGGMGGGRQGRGGMGGMSGGGSLSTGELSTLLAPAQELHVSHQDPMLLIADENDQRQRFFTDFRGASVSASGGLQQRVSVAGWEGEALVVETTMLGKKMTQNYQIDSGTGRLVIFTVAQVSEGLKISYRLVYDRLKPDPDERQARRNVSAGQGETR